VVETEKQIDCGLLLLLLEIDSACNASKKPDWNPNSAEGDRCASAPVTMPFFPMVGTSPNWN
jgi:hypothetical protein